MWRTLALAIVMTRYQKNIEAAEKLEQRAREHREYAKHFAERYRELGGWRTLHE